MTIVELYDNYPINNVIGALCYQPEQIVFVGSFSEKKFKRQRMPVLRRFLQAKGLGDIELSYRHLKKDDLPAMIEELEKIYTENEDCRFNIEVTGGEDLVLVAIGALCQRHPEIKMIQISSRLRSVSTYSLAEPGLKEKLEVTAVNSVRDNLLLHGGDVVCADGRDQLAQGWALNEDFVESLRLMWKVCCEGVPWYKHEYTSLPGLWNRIITCLGALDGASNAAGSQDTIAVREQDYIKYTETYCDPRTMDRYLEYMDELGIIKFKTEKNLIWITYKDEQIRAALSKSGTLLELIVYLECRELFGDQGDIMSGVTIDWDWEVRNDPALKLTEDVNTLNEMDILATSGLTPYFISCKNGKFTSDELYKLSSVAERFGGVYSRKLIVCSDMDITMPDQAELIRRRAEDMGIAMLEKVHTMTPSELREALGKKLELGTKAKV